ncbi:MAG: sugar phosphate isomerase/epimerase [Firmicutes bacterium]|nr:sugar phosphate isomerase/epimerase [Bacillota bacterium]
MKFSFSTLGCPQHSFDQIIDLVRQVGYTGVEIRIYKNTEDLRTLGEFKLENLDAVRRKFQSAGIEITCVSSSARFAYPGPGESERADAVGRGLYEDRRCA